MSSVSSSISSFAVAPAGILLVLIPTVVSVLFLYWIIRLAVRHGIRDSRR